MIDATPEEKLLNLIKKGQSKAGLGKELKIFTKVNIVLMALIMVVIFVFLADVFVFKQKASEELPSLDIQPLAIQIQPVTAAQDEDIKPEPADNTLNIKKASAADIASNLNLLGIITGDNNQAIIEDKNSKKTFFLYKGDSLGESKVYDIKDSAVILDYKGEKIELKI